MMTMSAVHRTLYRASAGKLGGSFMKAPVLLLTTTGRRTGNPRTKPVLYLVEGEQLVVGAANGGDDRMPAWYLNLAADPVVTVQIRATMQPMRAATATSEERDKLWPRLVEMYKGYGAYQKKTRREIPVVILSPR